MARQRNVRDGTAKPKQYREFQQRMSDTLLCAIGVLTQHCPFVMGFDTRLCFVAVIQFMLVAECFIIAWEFIEQTAALQNGFVDVARDVTTINQKLDSSAVAE